MKWSILCAILVSVYIVGEQQINGNVLDSMKHDFENARRGIKHVAKVGAKDVAHESKLVVGDAGPVAKKEAQEVANGAKKAAHNFGHVAKKEAQDVAQGAQKAAKDIRPIVRTGVKDTGKVVKASQPYVKLATELQSCGKLFLFLIALIPK